MEETTQHPGVIWRKGSRSMANGTCVEVASMPLTVSEGDSDRTTA
jgi:hypothetical protein